MRASAFGLTRVEEFVFKFLISRNARRICVLCFVAGLTFEVHLDAPGGKGKKFPMKSSLVCCI
jgi:hypothetical protein